MKTMRRYENVKLWKKIKYEKYEIITFLDASSVTVGPSVVKKTNNENRYFKPCRIVNVIGGILRLSLLNAS